ncbi:Uncharacterised protein [Burkholderia pseudomallei]|uniref:hypothetical protein n=1 Tax=Burkholderia pseudomallei TaxID=28450 RepID=UPI000F18D0BD|nr:hypothetical protein [Burkholderia pseudomallei]VBP71109.1 Uncharacterised protein [Burkholderia pseudomallei]
MTTNENPAAVRVCAIADIQCSRGCGTGACKREAESLQPAAAPIDDARECLMDVVSHHHDFVTACKSIKGELHACGAHDSAAYWQKQIDVLDRMKAQAERALATSANEIGAEGPAIELLRKFMEYRDSDYVPNVLFDCARTIIDNAMAAAAPADERASGMPDEVRDSMMDSQYLAGVTAGWNAANADDPNAALKKIHDAYSGYLNPLRDWQKAGRPGAPATPAMADERAECIAWANANGFPKYHESMCAAWEERARRAAASPAAEAVTITDAEAEMLVGIKKFHTHDFGRGPELHADAITDACKRGRAAAPQPAQAGARGGLTATVIQKCIDSCAAEYLEDVTDHPEDAAYCQGITDCIDALNRLKTADWSAILAAHSGQSEPETATVARIEQLRKALFESRDAMRVMSNWVKKSDPAGHSWAVRMVDRANAALNGEPEPRAEVMLFADNDERDEFIRVCQDFDDDGETCVDYELLMKWASNGLLDCDHFTITKKGRAAIDAARTGASS